MADGDVPSSCWASSRVPSRHAHRSRRFHDKRFLPSDEHDSAEEFKTVLHFIETGAPTVELILNRCYFFHCRVIIKDKVQSRLISERESYITTFCVQWVEFEGRWADSAEDFGVSP